MSRIGIIGGSGFYNIEGIKQIKASKLDTPFGQPSDEFILGKLEGQDVVFLTRHGKGHRLLPTEINYRANIYGMKKLGVERIISVSAVGSLKEELKPQHFLLADQFVDRTNQARKATFFGEGIVAHVGFADPVCAQMRQVFFTAAKELSFTVHPQGTYVNMEGPAFSTRAESKLYRSWGMDVIGMTNISEARLAREAEICYVSLAMITDYDCWRSQEESVSVDLIIQNMIKNVQNAKSLIKLAITRLPQKRDCPCAQALKDAIVTDRKQIPDETKKKLDIIIGKYI